MTRHSNRALRITQKAINETGSYEYPVVIPKVIEIAEKEGLMLNKPLRAQSYLCKYYLIQTTGDIIAAIEQLRRQHDTNI